MIVSATGAYFPNVIKTKKIKQNHSPFAISHKPVHICYCHTPPRYLYGYATAREWKKNIVFRVLGAVANHFLRIVDFHASQNVDYYIANSEEVRGRIQKFYRREATVIYPPIDINSKPEARNPKQIKNTKYKIPDTEYYVAGGRLARPKHIDLIVRACKEQKLPLKVFGKAFAGYGEELEALTKNNEPRTKKSIELLGEVSDEEKWELLANAKAYIFASEDEDFGILPVEAMAAGTPVIAYRSGGVQETVVDGKTGVFFDELSVSSLASAIKRFEKTKFDDSISTKHARQFSSETFKKKIDAFVKEHSK